jgi:hypothetical protein
MPRTGRTGTIHDGNNANLQVPPERNAYWARLWAQSLGAFSPVVSNDYRQTISALSEPLIEELKRWLGAEAPQAVLEEPAGQAVDYSVKHWSTFTRSGQLPCVLRRMLAS